MGCEVQFHIKPTRRKTFGEHSGDGFYLRTSAKHYRTHIVFVKKTRAQRLVDTVFFKHKYITQPTVTPADANVNAYNRLRQAILGIQHSKDDAQMDALERIKQTLQPTHNRTGNATDRVHSPRVNSELTQDASRVRFDDRPPSTQESPPRLVVVRLQEQIV